MTKFPFSVVIHFDFSKDPKDTWKVYLGLFLLGVTLSIALIGGMIWVFQTVARLLGGG